MLYQNKRTGTSSSSFFKSGNILAIAVILPRLNKTSPLLLKEERALLSYADSNEVYSSCVSSRPSIGIFIETASLWELSPWISSRICLIPSKTSELKAVRVVSDTRAWWVLQSKLISQLGASMNMRLKGVFAWLLRPSYSGRIQATKRSANISDPASVVANCSTATTPSFVRKSNPTRSRLLEILWSKFAIAAWNNAFSIGSCSTDLERRAIQSGPDR